MEHLPHFPRHDPPAASVIEAEATRLLLDQNDITFDLARYLIPVRRHLRLIIAIFVASVSITALKVSMLTPIYTATSTVLINTLTSSSNDPAVLLLAVEAEYQGPEYYQTQVELLKSGGVAARVISKLGLDHDPAFTGAGHPPGFLSALWEGAIAWVKGLFGLLAAAPSAPEPPSPAAGDYPDSRVSAALVANYLSNLKIDLVPNTTLVHISFSSPSPALAARVANAHATAYIRQGIELQSQNNLEAERFLQEKLVDLKERLEKSEAALNDYRREKGIIPGLTSLNGKDAVVLDRLTDLSRDLTHAQVAQMNLAAEEQMIKRGHFETLSAVLADPLIAQLQSSLNTLYAERAALSNQFKPDYPPLTELDAKIQATKEQFDAQVRHRVAAIDSSYEEASAKVDQLQAEMDRQRSQTLALNDAAAKYSILQREVDTNKELYDAVLKRMKDVGFVAESETSNISVVDNADLPGAPSYPRKTRALGLAAAFGLAAGIGLAFLLEYLDNKIKGPDEVESYLHLPSLGVVPEFATLELNGSRRDSAPAPSIDGRSNGNGSAIVPGDTPLLATDSGLIGRELVTSHGFYSMLGEAYRSFRTALLLSRAGAPPRVTLVTSALDSEGKTVSAINTAIMLAQFGADVLLIDADLRRSRCHRVLAVENHLGLADVLTGRRELSEMIRPTRVDHLYLLSSGSSPPNPNELLGSQKMHQTLEVLREQYDYVVIDSPPVVPVSDAVLLSQMADGVVLVVNGSRTSKQQVKLAVQRLEYARAKILGVLLNKIHLHGSSYYYYGHYYGHYYSHYASQARPDGDDVIEQNA